MGNIYKADFQVDNGTDYDKYNFSTSADQVSYQKNGKETNVQEELDALNTSLDDMLSPIKIVYKDYDITPTANNSVVDLKYDLSDLLEDGYIPSQIVDVKVLYTDSYKYQQVTITNLSSIAATAKIMCLNTTSFKIRIYLLIYRESAIAH